MIGARVAKFILPFSGEIQLEETSVEEALGKAYAFQDAVMTILHGN